MAITIGIKKFVCLDEYPETNYELIKEKGGVQHYCPNYIYCPPQIKGRFEHFISKKAMNIDGLGPETIELLFDNKLILLIQFNFVTADHIGFRQFMFRSLQRSFTLERHRNEI